MELAVQVNAETKASKSSKLVLPKAVSATIGFRLILSNTLDHMRANIPAARDGDPEGIHQLRIGIRRTRAVLKLFQKQLSRNLTRRFDRRLRHYGQVFGEERNWDVFVATIGYSVDDQQRRRVREQVAAELDRSQFRNLVDRLDTWGGSGSIEIGSRRLDKMLPELLERRRKKLLSRARKAKLSQPESVHRVRKALKHLRYSSEFAAGLYGKKSVKRYLRSIKRASDRLGDMNDAATCASMLAKLDECTQRVLHPRVKRQLRQARRHVPKAFQELHAKPFW